MSTEDDDPPDAKARASTVAELPLRRNSPLRRGAKVRKLPQNQCPPLPDNEPTLTWDHWAIGAVIAGSFVAAMAVLIFN